METGIFNDDGEYGLHRFPQKHQYTFDGMIPLERFLHVYKLPFLFQIYTYMLTQEFVVGKISRKYWRHLHLYQRIKVY